MARLYKEARQGRLPIQDATRLAHILALIGRIIEGGEIEERLARLEAQDGEAPP
jgi:hypothetical protein